MDRKAADKIERKIATTDKQGFIYYPADGERINEHVLNELEKEDRVLLPLTITRRGKTVYLFIAFGTSLHHWWQIMTIAANAHLTLHPAGVPTKKKLTTVKPLDKAGIAKKLNDLRWSLQAQTQAELPEFTFLDMEKDAATKILETITL
ncbi:hypothetical protein EVB87_033 [Rhizobium phage RHph_N28_1]|nr:hypothetical protein EVB87_033 [Rhizobium phage RHph_N28_1]QIG74061.1 hypothetical protein EVC07_033 [Rhizobium phage RHph_N42]